MKGFYIVALSWAIASILCLMYAMLYQINTAQAICLDFNSYHELWIEFVISMFALQGLLILLLKIIKGDII